MRSPQVLEYPPPRLTFERHLEIQYVLPLVDALRTFLLARKCITRMDSIASSIARRAVGNSCRLHSVGWNEEVRFTKPRSHGCVLLLSTPSVNLVRFTICPIPSPLKKRCVCA